MHPGALRADLRFEAVYSQHNAADNGELRGSIESQCALLGVTVSVAARAPGKRDRPARAIASGQCGCELGRLALNPRKLRAAIAAGLEQAYERARASAREKARLLKLLGSGSIAAMEWSLAPVTPVREEVAAIYQRDPRTLDAEEPRRLCREASAAIKGLSHEIAFNFVGVATEFRHELFASSEGALISQAFAFSQGNCYVVAQSSGGGHQESYDTIGQQRGFECLSDGHISELMPNPDLRSFAVELASETRDLARAPVLTPPDREVTVVTDPHFNALVAHEILGHPCEADRALKMEAAYAGRSWFLRSLHDNETGKQVASPMLSACSDPSLDGYGHYCYDHEGTPGIRVTHLERGVFRDFLNSRATAAVLNAQPNGSARASDARYVPLIRMSNTFFMPGQQRPEQIIGEVEHGYYVCGHRIPSIAESRENFRISARRIYEIDHGRLGRMFRSGAVMADTRNFFKSVDAVGNDLRLIAIPNCGKGQPMQVKRMSNGGPTIRARARLTGG